MSDPANDSTETPPMTEFEAQVARDRAFAIAQNQRRGIAPPPKPNAERRNNMPVRADMTRPGAMARGITAHVNMTHSAGARVVQGPANKHGMPVGQGANTTVRVVEGVPDRIGNRQQPVRPNVAPRPGTGGGTQHGTSVRVLAGQPSPSRPQQLGSPKPFARAQAPIVSAVVPEAAPVTPLSPDQMLFLMHLCDAVSAQASTEPGVVDPRYVAFAHVTKDALANWMTEIQAGAATSTGTAVAPSSAAPIAAAPSAPIVPVAPAITPPAAPTPPATEK
jgi:hypothetical protein